MSTIPINALVPAGSSLPILARVDGGNTPVTQATVSSISYTVTDRATGQVLDSGTLTVVATIWNQLQQGSGWIETTPGVDGLIGWNFLWTVPGADLPLPGMVIDCRASVVMTNGAIVEVWAAARTT